jgi:hypothetical protein
MPSATDKYRIVGDMWERGMALLAWKLDGRGTVVDDVVVLSSGVVGGSSGVYRRIRGEETVNTQQAIAIN